MVVLLWQVQYMHIRKADHHSKKLSLLRHEVGKGKEVQNGDVICLRSHSWVLKPDLPPARISLFIPNNNRVLYEFKQV